ncbi:MAG: P-loop NTPase [Prevotellaceae bacterium]|jgi:ATP-binding protein involved in chromosome partitioning|nr:P-loop NTPase [Prevotellaceae bacterium]
MYNINIINNILKEITHPETEADIVSLGMVHKLETQGTAIKMTLLFKPNDPFVAPVKRRVEAAIRTRFPEAELNILELKRDAPKPKPKPARREYPQVDAANIVAVASGKGGVGKSTVATNLAAELAGRGFRVGLLDADVYGPSAPVMFNMPDARPAVVEREGLEYIEPVEKFGIKIMSLGFFVSPEDAVIWRGPAATGALRQFAGQCDWGALDFLLIDLPPGTGDVHLTMVRELKITAAVIVTTPQRVALADVIRGVNMFRNPDINVPVAGLIENMSWFTPAELPENRYYIFGSGGGRRMADETGIAFLGEIPLVQSIRESGDAGRPFALDADAVAAPYFRAVADNLLQQQMVIRRPT